MPQRATRLILLSLALAFSPISASAGTAVNGVIARYWLVPANSHMSVEITNKTGKPACDNFIPQGRFAFDVAAPGGKALAAAIMAKHSDGGLVSAGGTDACTIESGAEDLLFFSAH